MRQFHHAWYYSHVQDTIDTCDYFYLSPLFVCQFLVERIESFGDPSKLFVRVIWRITFRKRLLGSYWLQLLCMFQLHTLTWTKYRHCHDGIWLFKKWMKSYGLWLLRKYLLQVDVKCHQSTQKTALTISIQ